MSGVRKPNSSASDLLSWSETPPPSLPAASSSGAGHRSHQPSDGISKALFGGQITEEEEAQSLNRRKPCSGYKLKEITGNKIFGAESPNSWTFDFHSGKKTSVHIVQQATKGMSQISFSSEEKMSPKKPVSLPEVAKQRELSGTLENESNMKTKKPFSDAKCKELSGNDIFGPPPELPPRTLGIKANKQLDEHTPQPPARNVRTSIRVSNPAGGQSNIMFSEEAETKAKKKTIHNQKFVELSGNDIFKGDAGSSEKPAVSSAKRREMRGSDIFGDGKVESRDYLGGVRKPPGGETSIALI